MLLGCMKLLSCAREITILTRVINRKVIVFICFKSRKAHSINPGRQRAPPKHPKLNLESLSPPHPALRQEVSPGCVFWYSPSCWTFSKPLCFSHLTFLSWLHILIFLFILDFFKISPLLIFLCWLPAAPSPTLSELIWGWSLGIRPTFPIAHLRFINPYASQLM